PVRKIGTTEADGESPRFWVKTDSDNFTAESLVITRGGRSYPGCGTTGDGYAWAKKFGHSIVPTVPALAPVASGVQWVNALSGVTIEDVELSVCSVPPKRKQKPLDVRRGPLLFTHFGFSGPTVMNLSREIARFEASETEEEKPDSLVLRCNFLPNIKSEELADRFRLQQQKAGKQSVAQSLTGELPRRLVESLLERADVPVTQRNAELSKKQIQRLTEALMRTECPVQGTLGYKKAEVTAGGVALSEVDSRNMQSKLQPTLFFAGEILDLDGPIGGFNFQAAFSTGHLAGQHV
ncbi:MAG: aminoacetone oxidase family FAD-binding enzyme, partial [Planctomycetaceae bacterium]